MVNALEYQEWKTRYGQILETFPGKKVLLFFSGGKDSSAALNLIQKAGEEFKFSFEVHGGIFPQHVFSSKDLETINSYWNQRNVTLNWHEIGEPDKRLEEALEQGISPCLICNRIKKQVLLKYIGTMAIDINSLVIVMSYSLWDLVSASIEHILGSVYASKESSPSVRDKPSEERFLETFQRFYPLLKLRNGFTIFKPLINYNDQEILNLVTKEGIPVLSTDCMYHEYRPKRLFAKYFKEMNLRFDLEKTMDFAKNALDLPDETYFADIGVEQYLKHMI